MSLCRDQIRNGFKKQDVVRGDWDDLVQLQHATTQDLCDKCWAKLHEHSKKECTVAMMQLS